MGMIPGEEKGMLSKGPVIGKQIEAKMIKCPRKCREMWSNRLAKSKVGMVLSYRR